MMKTDTVKRYKTGYQGVFFRWAERVSGRKREGELTDQNSEAQETIEKISHDESNLKFRQLSADIDAWSGNYDNAIEKYQKLILQFPEDRDLWSQLIQVLSWAKKWPLLLETLQTGKDKIEMNDDIRALLVNAHVSMGEPEKGQETADNSHPQGNQDATDDRYPRL